MWMTICKFECSSPTISIAPVGLGLYILFLGGTWIRGITFIKDGQIFVKSFTSWNSFFFHLLSNGVHLFLHWINYLFMSIVLKQVLKGLVNKHMCLIQVYLLAHVPYRIFDKLIWCTISPKSLLFGTAPFSHWTKRCS